MATTKGRKYPPQTLEPAEVLAMLEVCRQSRGPSAVRNAALIALLWRTGLRIGEALQLTSSDLEAQVRTILVRHGKGNKSRVVALDPTGWAYLDRWLDRRKQLGINGHRSVFCTLKGGPLAYHYVNAMLKRVAKKAGIEKRVHPHGLRHSAAVDLLREGHDLMVIRDALGHANSSTTDVYLRRLHPEQVIAALRDRPWPSVSC